MPELEARPCFCGEEHPRDETGRVLWTDKCQIGRAPEPRKPYEPPQIKTYDLAPLRQAVDANLTKGELLRQFDLYVARMREVMVRKNNDYAGSIDPLRNLRMAGAFGVATRLSDKCSRMLSLDEAALRGDGAQVDEKLLDTEIDLSIYGFLHTMIRGERL